MLQPSDSSVGILYSCLSVFAGAQGRVSDQTASGYLFRRSTLFGQFWRKLRKINLPLLFHQCKPKVPGIPLSSTPQQAEVNVKVSNGKNFLRTFFIPHLNFSGLLSKFRQPSHPRPIIVDLEPFFELVNDYNATFSWVVLNILISRNISCYPKNY